MKPTNFFASCLLFVLCTVTSVFAADPRLAPVGSPLPTEAPADIRYRYYYNTTSPPNCLPVGDSGEVSTIAASLETMDWPSFIAAMRAAKTKTTTPVLGLDSGGVVEACGNSHGHSACCAIDPSSYQPLTGTVDIICN